MTDIDINSIIFKLDYLILDYKPKSFILNGIEYFLDHTKKPKLDEIVDITKLKDIGCKQGQGLSKNLECINGTINLY